MTDRQHAWKTRLAIVFWILIVVALICWPAALIFAADRPNATPAATADQWMNNPDSALASIVALAKTLAHSVSTWNWSTTLLAVVGGLVAVLRLTPAWGPLAGGAWDMFMATRKDKAIEKEMATQADGFKFLVKTIENLPPGSSLTNLRDKLARKMPESVKNAVETYLDQNGRALHLAVGTTVDPVVVNGQTVAVAATEQKA